MNMIKEKVMAIQSLRKIRYKYIEKDNKPIFIINGLYIGTISCAYDFENLKKYNIKYIISLTSLAETKFTEIEYLKIDIQDTFSENIFNYFNICNTFIQNALNKKSGNVLIHCFAGISRSATIATAYLMKMYNYSMNEALDLIKSKRIEAKPNKGFLYQLKKYENELNKCKF